MWLLGWRPWRDCWKWWWQGWLWRQRFLVDRVALYIVPARDWQSGIRHRWWCFEIRTIRCELWRRKFEAGPSFLLCGETFPGFSVVDKDTSLVDELEGDSNYLLKALGGVTGSGIVTPIFEPVEKGFNQLVCVIRGAEDSVVFLQICGGDVGVGGV